MIAPDVKALAHAQQTVQLVYPIKDIFTGRVDVSNGRRGVLSMDAQNRLWIQRPQDATPALLNPKRCYARAGNTADGVAMVQVTLT